MTYDRISPGRYPDCVAEAVSVLFERCFARRPHEKRDVGIRNAEAGRIDRRGERWFAYPPPEPFAEFPPLKPQGRPQERFGKPLALTIIEPRPTLHRGLEQITAASRDLFNVVLPTGDVSGNKSDRSRR